RFPRFHTHRLEPSADVARYLHRQPPGAPRRARSLQRAARPSREAAAGGRRQRAREALQRGARRARSMAEVLELNAARGARGTVRLPGPKSSSNRLLLIAALAAGATEVSALLDADDAR